MNTAQIAHDARRLLRLIGQLRVVHGFSEVEARDYLAFCIRNAESRA